jgi:hypothetical protein
VNTVLPLSSSVVSLVFAAMVFDQWRQRRQAFQLVWTVGLLFYGVASGTEFLGSAFGWSSGLYRAWYLVGAFYVAAYLGMGTIYLLAKTNFGYFAGVTILSGGLLSLAASKDYPGSATAADVAFAVSLIVAVAVIAVTALQRPWAPHLALAALLLGSLAVALVVAGAPVSAPGFAVDPQTGVPVASAFPGNARVLSLPFNVAGGLCLVFGAAFSAYVYMPKRKLLAVNAVRTPVLAQGWYFAAVVVNFVASLPSAVAALFTGRLNSRVPATILIAIGGLIPSVTSGLSRFGITWYHSVGALLGALLIFSGFLVSEEVFRNLRLPAAGTVWQRPDSKAEASG